MWGIGGNPGKAFSPEIRDTPCGACPSCPSAMRKDVFRTVLITGHNRDPKAEMLFHLIENRLWVPSLLCRNSISDPSKYGFADCFKTGQRYLFSGRVGAEVFFHCGFDRSPSNLPFQVFDQLHCSGSFRGFFFLRLPNCHLRPPLVREVCFCSQFPPCVTLSHQRSSCLI